MAGEVEEVNEKSFDDDDDTSVVAAVEPMGRIQITFCPLKYPRSCSEAGTALKRYRL
jgi:hypothetical protein